MNIQDPTGGDFKKAFHLVHNNLSLLPDRFCYWRKESVNGKKVSKTLQVDYRPIFSFIKDSELRNNLAELRMCLDYHRSIYEFINPGLTFGWQHKLVICQLVAAVYEGLLFDFIEHKTNAKKKNTLASVIADERLSRGNTGLGYLLDLLGKVGFFKNQVGRTYLQDIKHIRDTVHPRSLNSPKASYKENKVSQESVGEVIEKLDKFISLIQDTY